MNKKFGRLLRVVLRVILALLLFLTSIPAWQGNALDNDLPGGLQIIGFLVYGITVAAFVIISTLIIVYIVRFIITGEYKVKL